MIELKHVSFAYQGQEHDGLHDINLTIADGECVLFCGRSGCGKTTITRLVNGLIPQFYAGELTGSVLVDGQEISKLPMYQIAAKVGSVFQNPRTQFFNVDTDSEIAFGIENEARPPVELAERVEQATDDLHIRPLRNRNIFELSGGEKQKIAFASVYAMNPEIYLLDEPSSNLDMASIQELKGHLRLLQKQGKTILIAEHRLYYLMDLADRIVYLEQGRIEKIFTPEEFRRLPREARERMGLRAADLAEVRPPQVHPLASSPVLELRDVTLRYKKRTILHRISLAAAKGEVIGVVGHNGAGKTTFSRALCGLRGAVSVGWTGNGAEEQAETLLHGDAGCELRIICRECGGGVLFRHPQSGLDPGRLDSGEIGAGSLSGAPPQHAVRRAEAAGGRSCQHDLRKRPAGVRRAHQRPGL